MAYVPVNPLLGIPAIGGTSTTALQPLGTIVEAYDTTLGSGEFIYLLGVAGTVVGSLVTFDATTWQTALSAVTGNQVNPVAVAMSANVAGQYGWYQIEGNAVIKKTAVHVTPQVAVFQSATTGRIMSTVASGKQILAARSANLTTVTATVSTVIVTIDRPSKQGQVT